MSDTSEVLGLRPSQWEWNAFGSRGISASYIEIKRGFAYHTYRYWHKSYGTSTNFLCGPFNTCIVAFEAHLGRILLAFMPLNDLKPLEIT